jgi:hypothetical protein
LNAPTNTAEPSARTTGLSAVLGGVSAALIAALVLLLVGTFIYTAFYSSLLGTLRDAGRLATFLCNLFVVFYAFPAFLRTKDRAFLCIAIAALSFGYSALFSILLGVGPPATARHTSHSEAEWYYAARYITDLAGLVLYAYGIISLARRAKPKA